jgi:hypothetical protein
MNPYSDLPATVLDANEWVEILTYKSNRGAIEEWTQAVHWFWDSFDAVTR